VCGLHLYLTGLIPGTVPYPTSSRWDRREKLLGGGAALSLKPLQYERYEGIASPITRHPPGQQALHLHGNKSTRLRFGSSTQGTVTLLSMQYLLSTWLISGQMPGLDDIRTVLHCPRYRMYRELDDVWGKGSQSVSAWQ
jgi:hypothetical protein